MFLLPEMPNPNGPFTTMMCSDDNSFSSKLMMISGFTSTLSIIPSILCTYSINIILRRVHSNLRRLMAVISILFLIRPFVQTFEIIYVCHNGEDETTLLVTHIVRDIVVIMTRMVWITVGIERLLATIYVGTYEKSKKVKKIFWILVLFAFLFACTYAYYAEIIGNNIAVTYSILASTALIAVLMVSIIRKKNQELRRLSNKVGLRALALTEKYQIVENLRSLDYLMPHANIDGFTDFMTVGCGLAARIFFDLPTGASVFHLCLNLQILVFCIYWSRRNPQFKKLIQRYCRDRTVGPSMTAESAEPCSNYRQEKNYIKNPLGEKIQKEQTPEEHFSALRAMWT
uniref:G_PROTEIN_RECEP_F1_2 domain-containing protein n=1 Tax=Panagrellus redivivus TaxID=6233 RepID=A0A7E4UMA9_PANRE